MPLNSARNGNTRRELEPKSVPQVFLGLLLGTRLSAIGQLFSLQQYQKSLRKDRGPWFLEPVIDEASAWSTLRRGCDRLALLSSIETFVGLFCIWQELKQLGVDSREWRNNALMV